MELHGLGGQDVDPVKLREAGEAEGRTDLAERVKKTAES